MKLCWDPHRQLGGASTAVDGAEWAPLRGTEQADDSWKAGVFPKTQGEVRMDVEERAEAA